MADTTLSLGVDSSGVRSATEDLGKFARAGDKAETSTNKIEAAFKKQQAAAEEFGRSVGKAVVAVGAIAVGSAIALDRLIKSVGDFQDLADQTGSDPAGLASFKTAADIAGIGIESIATASVRLSSRLAKVGDDSKGAGRALAAIGIEVEKFKTLRPDEQYRAIAVALDGYADGAGKVAVATELFGQGGAKQLKALKEIAGQTEQNNGLTNEQIALADEYADASARLQSQLGLLAQKAAIEAAPALLALQTALIESISEVIGLDKATGNLATNSGVADFAEAAVRALGFVVDAGDGVARVFRVVGTTIGGVAAAAAALASGNLRQAQSISADLSRQVDSILSAEQFSARLDRAIAAGKKNKPAAAVKPAVDTSKFVNTPRGRKAGKTDNTEAAQLAADVDAIKSAYEQQANAFKNAESVLEALRSSGLVQDREYFAAKRQFIERNADAQIAELDAENQRFADAKVTGSERIRLDKQIAENKSKIAIIEADTSAKVTVLTIQQADALTKVARAYEQAEAAAQGYLDSLKQSQERELSGFGQGNKERERAAGLQQIQDRYQQQRQDLEQQRRAGQVSGEQYNQELSRIQRFQEAALSSYTDFFSRREELRKRADLGAEEALRNYFDSTQDTYGQIEAAVTDAFKGAEDALVKFAQTGKLSFSDLANSILSDLARIAIRQSITGPLANAIFGGGGGGFASVLGSVFGAGKADGGSVSAGGLYPINERGAEVLSIGSRDYLTVGSQGGKVTPINGSGQTVNVYNNFTIAGTVDRSTQAQISARAGEGVQRAMSRNT